MRLCAQYMCSSTCSHHLSLFLFNAPATTELYTLSLHDALPISASDRIGPTAVAIEPRHLAQCRQYLGREAHRGTRSEEHTSELQSHHDLVCRLLLEKKNKKKNCTQPETNKATGQPLSFNTYFQP